MTNNLGADYSHFKTPRLRRLYCETVKRVTGTIIVDDNDVKVARGTYLKFESAVQQAANNFYDVITDTLWTDPWVIVLSKGLGLGYIEHGDECKYRYAIHSLQHPFFDWCGSQVLDLINNEADRASLYTRMGKPTEDQYAEAVIKVIRMIGEPFIPTLPELTKSEEAPMSEEPVVSKEVILYHKNGGWHLQWKGKNHPTKMGGLPKSDVVYSNEFYSFVNGVAKTGFSLHGINYTIEVNKEFIIDTIIDEKGDPHYEVAFPVGHPVLDLLMIDYSVVELTSG
jgi:hypothetical protein